MRQVYIFITLLLASATLFVYWEVQNQEFIYYDEEIYVTDNPHVRQGLTWDNLRYAFTESKSGYWHPLTWISLMADRQLFLNNAGGYHWTSLIIHIANTILLFFTLSFMTKAPWRSGFAAALFAFHPLHVEAVAWIAARKDVLSGFFWMLALGAYAIYVKNPSINRYFLVLLAFVLGMMAKPTFVTLPVVLLLLDYWPLNRGLPPANGEKTGVLTQAVNGKDGYQASMLFILLEKIPLALLGFIIGLISIFPEGNACNLPPLHAAPLLGRIEHALISYINYLIKMFWPINLAAFYPYPAHFHLWKVIAAAGLLLIVSLLVFSTRKKHPYLSVGWFWYLVTLLPVIGLVQFWTHDIADRYTYLPLLGIFIMLAWGMPEFVSSWPGRRVILPFLACACLALLMFLARHQVSHWQDSYTLWSHTLNVTEDNPVAHNNLGIFLANNGKPAEAEAHYRQAIRLKPDNYAAYNNLGLLLANNDKPAEAEAHYQQSIRLKPDNHAAYNNLGILLAKQGMQGEASQEFIKALSLKPDYADAHNNLAIYLAQRGQYVDAMGHFLEAVRLNPDEAQFQFNVGLIYLQHGNNLLARQYFMQCLVLDKSFGMAKQMLDLLDAQSSLKAREASGRR